MHPKPPATRVPGPGLPPGPVRLPIPGPGVGYSPRGPRPFHFWFGWFAVFLVLVGCAVATFEPALWLLVAIDAGVLAIAYAALKRPEWPPCSRTRSPLITLRDGEPARFEMHVKYEDWS